MSRPTAPAASAGQPYQLADKYLVEVMVRTNAPHPGEMADVYEARHRELPDALRDAFRQQRAFQRRHPGTPVMAHVTLDSGALLHLGWFEDTSLDGDPVWQEQDQSILDQLHELAGGAS